jgi:pyrroloquinoline quinone biosynthesis protein D
VNPDHDAPPPDPSSWPLLAEGVRLLPDRHGGGMVLLYPEGVLRLNSTGADILMLCDGKRSIAEIISVLAETYTTPGADPSADVLNFLDHLFMRQLLRFSSERVP